MKNIFSILFSTRLMAILFLTFATAMAAGTFIESYYNTDTARIWVYNSWWFQTIMLFFVINFAGNIKRYQLYKKEKWATLLLHVSFLFIIIGAAITRYISYEGIMPIREGDTANHFLSDKNYLTIWVDGQYKGQMMRKTIEKPLLLSPAVYPPFASNNFSISDEFDGTKFDVSYKNFQIDVKENVAPTANGKLYLKMVESGSGMRNEHFLKAGQVLEINNILYAFNKPTKGAININFDGKNTTIESPFDGDFMRMADKMQGKIAKENVQPLMFRSLYNVAGNRFVFPDQPVVGKLELVSSNNYKSKTGNDALTLEIASQNQTKLVTLVGSKGAVAKEINFKMGKLDFTLLFGSKIYQTPFSVKLNKFIANKYPGTTNSFSSFESKVTILSKPKNFDADIYMNHVLDYQGYRFFQSSYDPDLKGTKLSVNHDYWGTTVTYIGYALLFFSMIMILFVKNTRFSDLKRKLDDVQNKKAKLLSILVLMFSLNGFSQNHQMNSLKINLLDSIKKYKVPEQQAEKFGRLVIQDDGGRMKPINTFSSELLRKVYQKNSFEGLNSDQVFLSMSQFPMVWYELPIIYIKKDNDSIRKIIGIEKDEKYTKFKSFFDENGTYKLSKYLDEASKTNTPDQFQKDFIETNKKVVLLNLALNGGVLKIFPKPNDSNNKWVSYLETEKPSGTDLDKIKVALPYYLELLAKGTKTHDYTMANTMLYGIEKYQKKYGKAIIPSDSKISAEILLNKLDVFNRLFYAYFFVGSLMLIFSILTLFFKNKILKIVLKSLYVFTIILFFVHFAGLAARWFISGHAPWSNAYESMIYVGFATLLFTLIFGKKSYLTIASGTFVTSMIMLVALMNYFDPEIANLQPVLNSYWLMIHVAIIVASYGPFALGMVLGLVAMLLMLFTNEKNKQIMVLNIKEITYINEMALTIGLVMLTIGNFLGGQWANESWGRYWSWDPKETWALISIMVYAFVIHSRFVPALRGKFAFNFMSVLAFASIVMTYVGVNFHLTGMHSYATGEKQNVDIYMYILATYLIFSGLVYFKSR